MHENPSTYVLIVVVILKSQLYMSTKVSTGTIKSIGGCLKSPTPGGNETPKMSVDLDFIE